MDKNKLISTVIAIAALVYIFSPADAVPGPVDDIVVALITAVAQGGLKYMRAKKER